MKQLLGIWNQKGNSQNLLEGIPRYGLENGEPLIETTITLKNWCLQHKVLVIEAVQTPLFGQSCLAYTYSNRTKLPPIYATESIAVACLGTIENIREIWEMLLSMGYSFETKTDGEIILHSINRYLETNFVSPILAIKTIMKRLRGDFAIMVLFAKEECLVVARSGYPLFIGTDDNGIVYVSTSAEILTRSLPSFREIEDGEPMLLSSVNP